MVYHVCPHIYWVFVYHRQTYHVYTNMPQHVHTHARIHVCVRIAPTYLENRCTHMWCLQDFWTCIKDTCVGANANNRMNARPSKKIFTSSFSHILAAQTILLHC